MKRNEHIASLSRDHHFGLLCAWKIKQGIKKGIPESRISTYQHYFWTNHLKPHFKAEEELLFTLYINTLTQQAITEHLTLENLSRLIRENLSVNSLSDFAQALEQHIRFEERIVFPYLEKTIPALKLRQIGLALKEIEQHNLKDNYEDEFWNS